jgi:glycosyltransferase involved in cell wall biosynthesis
MTEHPMLSVVIPLYNEEESVRPLVETVRAALADQPRWELVLVDDGSRDDTAAVAVSCGGGDGRIRVIRLARNYGQTQAMQAGW